MIQSSLSPISNAQRVYQIVTVLNHANEHNLRFAFQVFQEFWCHALINMLKRTSLLISKDFRTVYLHLMDFYGLSRGFTTIF